MIELYPLLFTQIHKELVWGIEDWMVSTVPGSESIVGNGIYKREKLSIVIENHYNEILGAEVSRFYDRHLL